jgi:hypothetical protein
MNSITIILLRDWCVPHQVIFLEEKSFHVSYVCIIYVYPTTNFNIKILVRDWCVPHHVICLEEKVFMCHISSIYVYPTTYFNIKILVRD